MLSKYGIIKERKQIFNVRRQKNMRSESVKLLVKNYPKDHLTMSNKEIADKYG